MGQDYAYMIAGQIGLRVPNRNLTFINRGIGGNRVRDLAGRWKADALDLRPDFLSILVGINDTLIDGESLEEFETTYDTLLADTLAAQPNIKIVLGEPMLLPVGRYKDNYPALLAQMKARQDVVLRLGAKYHLPVVRYQDVFDAALSQAPADYWSWDGVHPTYSGHALMAQAWLKAIAAAWPNG
jgi:lysophospholipase L1-like esterase